LILATALGAFLLFGAASLVYSALERPIAAEPEAAVQELTNAAPFGESLVSLPVAFSAPLPAPAALPTSLPPAPVKRPVVRVAPRPTASAAPPPTPEPPAERPSARRAPPPLKTNDLGFEFGF
jgi:hypothetical protein